MHLPSPPRDWLSDTSFALTRNEAEYLYQRIAQTAPQSLLAHLIISRQRIHEGQNFPWAVPFEAPLSRQLASQLRHAQNFSEIMHSAALLYNLLLAEQKQSEKFIKHYRARLQEWWKWFTSRRRDFDAWNRSEFWQLMNECRVRIRGITRQFVDAWMNQVLSASLPSDLVDGNLARRLVTNQEHAVKPGRARLNNLRATENWNGASGSAQLNYRWNRPVRAIINDILLPLCGPEDSDA